MDPMPERLRQLGLALQDRFLGRSTTIRMLLIAMIGGEHVLLVGPPGTAKSALARAFAAGFDARYFEYLLTRFSEPNELLGPLDVAAYQKGSYRRRTQAMLPEAEVAFVDEVFKGSSAILNALLTLLNERAVHIGGERLATPLQMVVGATNDVPAPGELGAVFDRFALRIEQAPLSALHFGGLMQLGLQAESGVQTRGLAMATGQKPIGLQELIAWRKRLDLAGMVPPETLDLYKSLVFQIRAEGVEISDRRAIKLLKLVACSALLDGRKQADAGDLGVLRHSWNRPDQLPLVNHVLGPVLEQFARRHPERQLSDAAGLSKQAIEAELGALESVLLGPQEVADSVLFASLRQVGELRAQGNHLPEKEAAVIDARCEALIEAAFGQGKLQHF